MRLAPAVGLAAGTASLGIGYWRHLSPYSQDIGRFPYSASGEPKPTPRIALTFDDGPNEPYTTKIAEILADRGVPATFFQVGRCVERHPGVTTRLAEAGHVIGNHSYAHRFSRGWTDAALRGEMRRARRVFADHLGRQPSLFRPPWLLRTEATFDVLEDLGMHPVSGEFCHALEPLQPTPRRIARRALAKARDGAILIFHDGFDDRGGFRGHTVEAVEIVVDELLSRGFSFATVDELMGVPAYSD